MGVQPPKRLLRDMVEKQVSMRSPIPESPESVSALPPRATVRVAISWHPRVMRAASVLCPNPSPIAIPAPIASLLARK